MDKLTLLGIVGASLIAGAASGYVAGGARKPDAPAAKPEPGNKDSDEDEADTAAVDEDDAAALRRRVARLEAQLSLLKKGLALAQAGGVQEGSDGSSAPAPVLDSENPVFELAVRDVMDRVQQEERQTRQDRWRQRSNERIASQVDTVAAKVQLTESEKEKLREILADQAEKFLNLRAGDAGAPQNRQEWRDRMRQIRDDTDSAISQALGADRGKSVSEALAEDSPAWGGGRRRAP